MESPFNAGGHSTRQPGFSTVITLFVPWLYSCGNQGCLHGPVASLEAPGPASSLSYYAEDSPGRCLKIQLLSIIPPEILTHLRSLEGGVQKSA